MNSQSAGLRDYRPPCTTTAHLHRLLHLSWDSLGFFPFAYDYFSQGFLKHPASWCSAPTAFRKGAIGTVLSRLENNFSSPQRYILSKEPVGPTRTGAMLHHLPEWGGWPLSLGFAPRPWGCARKWQMKSQWHFPFLHVIQFKASLIEWLLSESMSSLDLRKLLTVVQAIHRLDLTFLESFIVLLVVTLVY